MTNRLLPMFSFYGAKHRTARLYPAPEHGSIVEPFAGSAAYASAYPDRHVTLVERDPVIAGLWRWLTRVTPAEVIALPLLAFGETTDGLAVSQEARWLIGFWCNKGTTHVCKRLTGWSKICPTSFWGPEIRQRVASQVERVRHWTIVEGDWSSAPREAATFFVDPPYVGAGERYRFKASAIDFDLLGEWCRSRDGQVIACENYGATWLPFRPFVNAKSSRGVSREVVWTSDRPRARQMPLSGAA